MSSSDAPALGPSAFERLHPALQYHIVNSLGWTGLRPVQEQSTHALLDGAHAVILAPTAGGKTEAAFFALLSRMLTENWTGTTILYLSPIRALLNNQFERIDHLCRLLGRTAAVWHGDTTTGQRKRVRKNLPDVLLTTPESLEAMLISTLSPRESMFGSLRAVVVDEVHAFARDDRGTHLLSVLDRIETWAGRKLQRVGLSATVGNRDAIVSWLAPDAGTTPRLTIDPARGTAPASTEVTLDWVESLENAAKVISKLWSDQKRLVFCDSRLQVEKLGQLLTALDVPTHITHSSLSAEIRRHSEEAFARGGAGVIVATSALELGLDVGDLDRVIQIDAPMTVASFLQRMGRTGRRAGKSPNCLFLAVSDDGFASAAALLDLWRSGYVEPAIAPRQAWQVAAQQAVALVLERPGIALTDLRTHVLRVALRFGGTEAGVDALFAHLVETAILALDGGRVGMGLHGEKLLGRRNFMALTGVFTTSPEFTVLFGQKEIGSVGESTFWGADGERVGTLLLGGQAWRVRTIDWSRRRAHVEPHEGAARTKWRGGGGAMSRELAQAHRDVFAGSERTADLLSRRARPQLEQLCAEWAFVEPEGDTRLSGTDDWQWFTFAGHVANRRHAAWLTALCWPNVKADAFCVSGPNLAGRDAVAEARAKGDEAPPLDEAFVERWANELKFRELLPAGLLEEAVRGRWG